MLLWGDLVEGGRPVLRRALAGFRAHECMYAWVYLTEYLAHKRLLEALDGMQPGERRELLGGLDGPLWQRLDRSRLDPHFQLSRPAFEAVAYMACLAASRNEAHPVFVELGSTFFTARTKFQIIDRLASERFPDWPRMRPQWIGIDNSPFMHDTTRALHPDPDIRLFDDYNAVSRPAGFAVFLSRFVASYAFRGATELADYLADRFQAAVVEDAYSTTPRDEPVFNHGQPEVFFSIPALFGRLQDAGFDLHVLAAYPDYPAGSAPCHVIRYVLARKGAMSERLGVWLAGLGLAAPGRAASPASLLGELNARVTTEQWRRVRKAKEESPVWGPTPPAATEPRLARARRFVRSLLADRRWRRYRLAGPMATREIERAVSEEKP
jgi:hypothetical protein